MREKKCIIKDEIGKLKTTKENKWLVKKLESLKLPMSNQSSNQSPIQSSKFLQKIVELLNHEPVPTYEKTQLQEMPKSSTFHLIPEKIVQKEMATLSVHQKISFVSNHRSVNLYFSSSGQENVPGPHFLSRVVQVIHILSLVSPPVYVKTDSTIYFYLTHAIKELPKLHSTSSPSPSSNGVIQEIHANTAFTYSYVPQLSSNPQNPLPREIVLFRKEEVFKVLIHELFHHLGLDFSNDDEATAKTALMLKTHLHMDERDIRLFETLTESWACILNCLFLSYWNHSLAHPSSNLSVSVSISISISISKWEKEFCQRIENEKAFAFWQCVKLMKHSRFHYLDFIKKCIKTVRCSTNTTSYLLSRNHKTQRKLQHKNTTRKSFLPKKYKEDTQVFCYFFLKSAVLEHWNDFLLTFPPRLEKDGILEFTSFVIHSFQQPEFYEKWEFYDRLFQQKKRQKSNGQGQWFFTTLRQTVNEIDITY